MGVVHTTGMHWDKETDRELGINLTIACSLMKKKYTSAYFSKEYLLHK